MPGEISRSFEGRTGKVSPVPEWAKGGNMSNETRLIDNCEWYLERAERDAKEAYMLAKEALKSWRADRAKMKRLHHEKSSSRDVRGE